MLVILPLAMYFSPGTSRNPWYGIVVTLHDPGESGGFFWIVRGGANRSGWFVGEGTFFFKHQTRLTRALQHLLEWPTLGFKTHSPATPGEIGLPGDLKVAAAQTGDLLAAIIVRIAHAII
ncbi:MAG: hypothetical protein HQL77_11470 [Magnetococcales bacterium]|nr:hypothetical protein [Magnetococcales bacterium]